MNRIFNYYKVEKHTFLLLPQQLNYTLKIN